MTGSTRSARRHALTMVLAAALAACGGGGGPSGGNVSVAPNPTPTPSPTPAPTPTPSPSPVATIGSIGAPALASAPANPVSPQASPGGPTFRTQPTATTTFPVLQSSLIVIDTFDDGPVLVADEGTMNLGASFDFAFCSGCRETFALSVPSLGISRASLNTFGDTPFTATLANGRPLFVEEATWGFGDLQSTKFGFWEIGTPFPTNFSAYVYGFQTPSTALPVGGTVTYSGRVLGRVFYPGAAANTATMRYVDGIATVRINFASGAVEGQLTDMRAFDGFGASDPWNSATLAGSLTSSPAGFVGTTRAVSSSSRAGGLKGSATGAIAARFYGSNAQELGLVWTLYDGAGAAVGSSGARF